MIMNQNETGDDIPADMTTSEITSRDKKLNDDYTVKINVPSSACVINQTDDDLPSQQNSCSNNPTNTGTRHTFPTILKMVVGSIRRNLLSVNLDEDEDTNMLIRHKSQPWIQSSKKQKSATGLTSTKNKQKRMR